MIWQLFLGLDLFSLYADPVQHLIAVATRSTADYLDDVDRDLSDVFRIPIGVFF